jgi:hypothetical protein
LSGSNLTYGGCWRAEEQRNVGGSAWQTTSGWGRRRRHCAGRAMTMTMTATGKEEVEGKVDIEGEGEGRRGRGLFSSPHNSKLVSSFIVTILTLHLFHYLYLAVLLLLVTKGNKSFKIPSTSMGLCPTSH